MFIGFFGGLLGTTGFVKKSVVGGTIGIDLPDKVPQHHKSAIKAKKNLPNYASASDVLKQAEVTSKQEANAFLLGKLKTLRLRELNARLKSYEHQADYAKGVADISVSVAGVDASTVKHLARAGLSLQEDRVEVDAYAQQFARNRSLFGS